MTARINKAKCAGCGACMDVCPVGAVRVEVVAVVNSGTCASCGLCSDVCPQFAIKVGPKRART